MRGLGFSPQRSESQSQSPEKRSEQEGEETMEIEDDD